jgi:DNA-binding MarR family transcriptional regulator
LFSRQIVWNLNQLSKSAMKRAEPKVLNPGALPRLIGYRLRLTQQAVFKDFAESVKGLSPGRLGVLVLIDANPGLTQSRLAEAVRRDRSTMVAVLDDLEARGLIARRRGEDRRTNGLWLTRSGRAFLAAAMRQVKAHERRFAARLTAKERATLFDLLQKLEP